MRRRDPNNDPIQRGLEGVRQGVQFMMESKARKEERALQNAINERQVKILESKEAREALKSKIENAPIDLTRYGGIFPEEYIKPVREKYLNDAVTSVVTDVDKPLPKYEMPRLDFEIIDKIRKANIEEMKAKKELKKDPMLTTKNKDAYASYGLSVPKDVDPEGTTDLPISPLSRPPVVKPGEVQTLSPGVAEIADKIARGQAGYAEAGPLIRTKGDRDTVNSAVQDRRAQLAREAAKQNTILGQTFQAGQKIKDQLFQKTEKEKDRDIQRQNLVINQDRFAREVLQDTMSPAMQKHWNDVVTGKKQLHEGVPDISTDRDKEALASLKDIVPGLGKIDQRIIRPAFQAELNAVRAGKKRAIDVVSPDGYLTVAEGIEKANLLRHEATLAAKGVAEENRRTKAAGDVLARLDPRFQARIKPLLEQKAAVGKALDDIRSGDPGRMQAAQFGLAKTLDPGGRLSNEDYTRSGIIGDYRKQFDLWTKQMLKGEVPAWRREQMLKYFADGERLANQRIDKELKNVVTAARSGLKINRADSKSITDQDIINYYSGGEQLESPAASALQDIQSQPIQQPKGILNSIGEIVFGESPSGERKKYVPGKPPQAPSVPLDASKQRRLKELYKKRDELLKKQGKT